MGYPRDPLYEGDVQTFDGIGAIVRGDLLTVVYAGSSTLARTRWAFELLDRCCERVANGVLVMMLIPASSRPPDSETRTFMYAQWRRVEALERSHRWAL